MSVASRPFGSELRITVRDTGMGIAANVFPRIFDAFARADESRADGLGLGLWIVKHAAELLQHRVEVRSTEGRGSCFTIVADTIRHRVKPLPECHPAELRSGFWPTGMQTGFDRDRRSTSPSIVG